MQTSVRRESGATLLSPSEDPIDALELTSECDIEKEWPRCTKERLIASKKRVKKPTAANRSDFNLNTGTNEV